MSTSKFKRSLLIGLAGGTFLTVVTSFPVVTSWYVTKQYECETFDFLEPESDLATTTGLQVTDSTVAGLPFVFYDNPYNGNPDTLCMPLPNPQEESRTTELGYFKPELIVANFVLWSALSTVLARAFIAIKHYHDKNAANKPLKPSK